MARAGELADLFEERDRDVQRRKPLVTSSPTLVLALMGITGRTVTEADFAPGGPRVDAENFAFLGAFVAADNVVSSEMTRKVLGWEPTHPGLIDDLGHGHYFAQG